MEYGFGSQPSTSKGFSLKKVNYLLKQTCLRIYDALWTTCARVCFITYADFSCRASASSLFPLEPPLFFRLGLRLHRLVCNVHV